MEISTFKVKVQKAVSEVLGQEYTVELREVQKNNGVLLQGLIRRSSVSIRRTESAGRSMCPFFRILRR